MSVERKSLFRQFAVPKGGATNFTPCMIASAILIMAVAFLTGCSARPQVATTIPQAMASIQDSLARSGAVSVSHAASWTPEQATRFEQDVQAVQCSQQRSDPVVGVLAGTVTGTLSVQFTQGAQATVGALTTAPTIGAELSGSRTHGQSLTVPLSYAPLSSLPDVEMSRQIGYETELLAQNDDARHQEAARLIQDREALRTHVVDLIEHWHADQCIQHGTLMPLVGERIYPR